MENWRRDVDSLGNVFDHACVLLNDGYNQSAYEAGQNALKTCCGTKNYHTIEEHYTYCNISTPYDTVEVDNCLLDLLPWDTPLDFDCFPLVWELSSTMDTSAGMIATTWTKPDITATITRNNGSVVTETFDPTGGLITAASTTTSLSTASQTAGTRATGAIATPTSSKSWGSRFRLCYRDVALVVLSVVALAL